MDIKSGSYTLAEVASALNGEFPGEFDYSRYQAIN